MQTNDWHKECDDAADAEHLSEGFEAYAYARGSQDERSAKGASNG